MPSLGEVVQGVGNFIVSVGKFVRGIFLAIARVLIGVIFLSAFLALLLAVPTGAVYWFLKVTNDGNIDAGDAFLGLGYIGAAAAVVGLGTFWAARMYAVFADEATRHRILAHLPSPRVRSARLENFVQGVFTGDQRIVVAQLRYGCLLIGGGAALAIIFGLSFSDDKGVALAMGTAVVGAGAALLPAGAAANASNRILQSLPDRSTGQPSVRTGDALGQPAKDTATVQAAVSPAGRALELRVEYGTAADKFATESPGVSADASQELIIQNIPLTGLTAATQYFYRVVARDTNGNVWRGTEKQFTTAA